jgi:glycosyltransferase involved in cell wall biosynthesis
MKRILALTTNFDQASFRLRVGALRQPLLERGIDLNIQLRARAGAPRRAVYRLARDHDAVLVQRKLLSPDESIFLRLHARKIFFDVDDAVMYHPHEVSRWSRVRTTCRMYATSTIVDHVVAGNEYLAKLFRKRRLPVTVLPTTIDPTLYRVKEHKRTNDPALVWIGSKSTLPYLEDPMPAIRDAAARVPGLRLITIADRTLTEPGLPLDHIEWTAETETESLLLGDIGLAPMPCDRWTLGKCGFKILQYMAAGLPVIASPVGANREIIVPEVTGLFAETPQQWTDAIERLSNDVDLRQRMGQAGRERLEREYSLSRAVDVWADLLSKT